MTKHVLSFEVDDKTLATIEHLRRSMKGENEAQVIRRALALAQLAVANADVNNVVTLTDGHDKKAMVKIDG